ncbi:hypothetical protein BGZ57DRAFT_91989 [Hyaloscypha finlandica]|nr:hypothetical protein BGZ57DRAFT_91989 [Hyaloscypha finlandica]
MEPLPACDTARFYPNNSNTMSDLFVWICEEREDVGLKHPFLHKEVSRVLTIADEANPWIDSLCIDQQDYTERGRQVSQTDNIYRFLQELDIIPLQHLTPKSRTTPHLYEYSRNANQTESRKPVILETGSMGRHLGARELLEDLRTTNELMLEQHRCSKPAADIRYETVQEAHAKTFEWISQKSEDVVRPRDQFSQSCLSGKSGSGKSTLMRYIGDSWQRHRQADSNPYHEDLPFWAPSNASRRNSNWTGAVPGSVMSGDGPATRCDEMGLPTQWEREIGIDSADLVNLDVLYQFFGLSFSPIFDGLARVATNNFNVIRSLFRQSQFRSATKKRFRFGRMDFCKHGLVSLLLYASPVTATSVGSANHSYGGMNDCASFLNAPRRELEGLRGLFSPPQSPLPRSIPPHTLLLGCFLITAFTAILYTMIRAKPLTKFFLLIGILASTFTGAMFAVDLPDLVFRYLFVGTNFALVGSVWYHRFQSNKNMVQNRGFEPSMEEGKDVLEKEKTQFHD